MKKSPHCKPTFWLAFASIMNKNLIQKQIASLPRCIRNLCYIFVQLDNMHHIYIYNVVRSHACSLPVLAV